MRIMVFLLIASAGFLFPQKKDPDKILQEVIRNFESVQDYSVNVKVKVDVPFLKAPDTDAKIYFKQPDKIHFESERFAMVPREGLDFSPAGLLKKDYSALYIKEETLNATPHSVIKIIPLEDRGDVILSTLWIDSERKAISKVESSTKTSGTFVIELFYDKNFKYPLPQKMVFSFNFDMRGRNRMQPQDPDEQPKTKDEKVSGKVYITYSGYEVNKGIPDSIFEEKKK